MQSGSDSGNAAGTILLEEPALLFRLTEACFSFSFRQLYLPTLFILLITFNLLERNMRLRFQKVPISRLQSESPLEANSGLSTKR